MKEIFILRSIISIFIIIFYRRVNFFKITDIDGSVSDNTETGSDSLLADELVTGVPQLADLGVREPWLPPLLLLLLRYLQALELNLQVLASPGTGVSEENYTRLHSAALEVSTTEIDFEKIIECQISVKTCL